MPARSLLVFSLLTVSLACEGTVLRSTLDAGQRGDVRAADVSVVDLRNSDLPRADAPIADTITTVDLPTKHLDPCLTGRCGGDMLCLANLCHKRCLQSDTKCNDKVAECDPQEACRPASSFADACFPAEPAGTPCGGGTTCEGGTLCVNNNGDSRCLALCKTGCQSGQKCRETTTGCQVCL